MVLTNSDSSDTRAHICNVCRSKFKIAPPKRPFLQRLLDLLLGVLPQSPTYVPTVPGLSAGLLLVASPSLHAPPFKESVILVLDHSPPNQSGGAIGVIINAPNPGRSVLCDGKVLVRHQYGGPVDSSRVYQILHSRAGCDYSESVLGFERVDSERHDANGQVVYRSMPSASEHILRQCCDGDGEDFLNNVVYYHGFSAWRPGQLESEILCGDWALCAAEPSDIFDLDIEGIWRRLTQSGRLYYPETRPQ
eukprot:scaffold285_cov330-Pavlova_lutheri.AAC.91